jgi:Tol biopolymer transport system component
MYPTVSNNGNVYFHADYESTSRGVDFTKTDIYMSQIVDNLYSPPLKLTELCNSELSEWDPFISPLEEYLIFSTPRPDGYGSGDMYISFNKDGKWSSPKNMGPVINSPAMDYCASLSPDGKYLFFSSYRSLNNLPKLPVNYEEMTKTFNGPLNGYGDIYWVQSSIIDELR